MRCIDTSSALILVNRPIAKWGFQPVVVSLVLAVSLLLSSASAQPVFSSEPDSAVFLTHDIDNFWQAFDAFKKDTTRNPFGKEYIDIGSAGVRGFTPNRIVSADRLYTMVKKRRADYEKVRVTTQQINQFEKQCRSTFYALKDRYPTAMFPPVYFVVGAYNSGGTSNEVGLMIGAEMQASVANVPYIVAHELIHFQQKTWSENPSLLQQSIIEGAADFLGELISGANTNKAAMAYGDKHKERLCREFVARMDKPDYKDWLYGVSGKDDRPNDLGYWMGYQIVAAYYAKAADRKQAIKEIIEVNDYRALLARSSYLDVYLR